MLTDFQNLFTNRFIGEYAIKSSLTIYYILDVSLHYLVKHQCRKNYRKFDACIVINDKSQGSVATGFMCGRLFGNCFTTNLLLSLLVKQFLKFVSIWRSYRQEVTNRPCIICKSILLQYLFFCVAADGYNHTVEILVWPLCVSFS